MITIEFIETDYYILIIVLIENFNEKEEISTYVYADRFILSLYIMYTSITI